MGWSRFFLLSLVSCGSRVALLAGGDEGADAGSVVSYLLLYWVAVVGERKRGRGREARDGESWCSGVEDDAEMW